MSIGHVKIAFGLDYISLQILGNNPSEGSGYSDTDRKCKHLPWAYSWLYNLRATKFSWTPERAGTKTNVFCKPRRPRKRRPG